MARIARNVSKILTISAISLTLGSVASAMPAQLDAKARVHDHSYTNGYHHARGKLTLNNLSGKTMRLSCKVTVTWARKNGVTAKRYDQVHAQVGPHSVRKPHFKVKFHDPSGMFANIPAHVAPHCRLR